VEGGLRGWVPVNIVVVVVMIVEKRREKSETGDPKKKKEKKEREREREREEARRNVPSGVNGRLAAWTPRRMLRGFPVTFWWRHWERGKRVRDRRHNRRGVEAKRESKCAEALLEGDVPSGVPCGVVAWNPRRVLGRFPVKFGGKREEMEVRPEAPKRNGGTGQRTKWEMPRARRKAPT
jgi:hypothetical protein